MCYITEVLTSLNEPSNLRLEARIDYLLKLESKVQAQFVCLGNELFFELSFEQLASGLVHLVIYLLLQNVNNNSSYI